MNDVTAEELLGIARRYYPSEEALPSESERTPEFQRWQETWARAVESRPWSMLLDALRTELPGRELSLYTPAYATSAYACIIGWRESRPDGEAGYRYVRVAGAVSLLAPVYLVYGTRQLVTSLSPEEQATRPWRQERERRSPPELALPPTEEMQSCADLLARCIERHLGCRRLPLEVARVQLSGLRIHYLHEGQPPTLLNAFFFDDLENLA